MIRSHGILTYNYSDSKTIDLNVIGQPKVILLYMWCDVMAEEFSIVREKEDSGMLLEWSLLLEMVTKTNYN